MNNIYYKQLQMHEGLRLKPYRCTAGKLTIGYGRNLEDRGLTVAEAEHLLQQDVISHKYSLQCKLPWFKNLSYPRQWVLIDMCHQLGISGLLKFKNTLEYIKNGEYDKAADEMLDSEWYSQTPKRAKRLSDQMRTTFKHVKNN